MKSFNFNTTTKILFGKNKAEEMIPEIKSRGNSLLLAYGGGSIKKNGVYDKVVSLLKDNNIKFKELSGIEPNPRISSVREGVKICRENNLDFILAVGGGSVVDACKAIAAGVSYDGDPWDFMMMKAKVKNPLPIGVVLTLAATGTEMNGNAVISNEETLQKRPMGAPSLCPAFSVMDPVYTYSVNKWHTAAGATDIISHVFEFYFTPDKDAFVTDGVAEAIMKTCIEYGRKAIDSPEDYEARANLMWAGTLAINGLLSLGKTGGGDWATHMIEHEISAIYDLTHGAGLAIVFPAWMQYVLDEDNAWKFAKMARNVFGVKIEDDIEAAKKGIEEVKKYFKSLDMPLSLKDVDIDDQYLEEMGEKCTLFGAVGVMRKLEAKDVTAILKAAL
ncbi:iron-containing alcohol dehydrogenase [Marinilabiliaceae bacterium ANBcel2]|nr:iron-containing alcohol dehydrogenase [Marinilabiliaceae bacterium ANBcel2]